MSKYILPVPAPEVGGVVIVFVAIFIRAHMCASLQVISPVEVVESSLDSPMVLKILVPTCSLIFDTQTLMIVRSFATLSSPKNWAMASLKFHSHQIDEAMFSSSSNFHS